MFYERNSHDGLHANYGLGAFDLSVWTPVGLFSSGFRVTTLHLCTCLRAFVVVCFLVCIFKNIGVCLFAFLYQRQIVPWGI